VIHSQLPIHHKHIDEAQFAVPEGARQAADDGEAALLPDAHGRGVGRDDVIELHRREAEPPGGRDRVLAQPRPGWFGRTKYVPATPPSDSATQQTAGGSNHSFRAVSSVVVSS
jgi:hypothetical protein